MSVVNLFHDLLDDRHIDDVMIVHIVAWIYPWVKNC